MILQQGSHGFRMRNFLLGFAVIAGSLARNLRDVVDSQREYHTVPRILDGKRGRHRNAVHGGKRGQTESFANVTSSLLDSVTEPVVGEQDALDGFARAKLLRECGAFYSNVSHSSQVVLDGVHSMVYVDNVKSWVHVTQKKYW